MTQIAVPAGRDRPPTASDSVRIVVVFVGITVILLITTREIAIGRLAPVNTEVKEVLWTTSGGYIPAAIRAVERERAQLERERDAFDRFATAVESISASAGSGGRSSVILSETTTDNRELRDIRMAYRSTVMEVDHFERVFGEGLYENMRQELSEHVASAVIEGDQFSPLLKEAVIRQSRQALRRRESLLETIDAERDSLESARDGIRELEPSTETDADPSTLTLARLFDSDRRLDRCATEYERLLRDRQRHIRSVSQVRTKAENVLLQPYLYDTLEVDFPVLATVLERYDRLRERRRTVHHEIIYR